MNIYGRRFGIIGICVGVALLALAVVGLLSPISVYVKAAWPLPTIVGLNLIWYGAKDLRDIARFRRECAERAQEFEVRLAEMRERLR